MSTARRYETRYTTHDYELWEGDWELIYGTAVSMSPSPVLAQEYAVTEIAFQIKSEVNRYQCPCQVFTGLDWVISRNTVVRPDVMLVCGELPDAHLERAPSLVVEVLSESTQQKDLTVKRELYEDEQVAHYLIADVDARTITWLKLNDDGKYEVQPAAENRQFTVPLADGCLIGLDRSNVFKHAIL